jgi:hypothetical protein
MFDEFAVKGELEIFDAHTICIVAIERVLSEHLSLVLKLCLAGGLFTGH